MTASGPPSQVTEAAELPRRNPTRSVVIASTPRSRSTIPALRCTGAFGRPTEYVRPGLLHHIETRH